MDSEENATTCSVCREIYSDPRSLACGHSFCLKCLKGVAGNNQTFPCPICRFDVDLRCTNVHQLPKNYVLCNVIEARKNKQPSMCLDHNKSLDLFCQRCDVVICSKCLTMKHKGHAIEDIDKIYIERNKQLGAFVESTTRLASMTQKKSDAVKQSRISMQNNIDSISETVENTFKKWNDALRKQRNAIFSYLHQERDKKRQVFVEAERILAGFMTTVTGLDTEINKLMSKDAVLVVQQYDSIKARLEDTERKIMQKIETCFTPPNNLAIEVYAPWIEEAINNIKHIDMKQTKAKPGRQKIAEIQEENVMLMRACDKLRIALHELEQRECEKLRITLQEFEQRKTNEVEHLEYLNQCLNTLIQYLHDHVVYSAGSSPRKITQPAEIAKRYQHAKEICAQFTKVEKELSESKQEMQEMANKIKKYKQNYGKLRAEHQNLETTCATLQKQCNDANVQILGLKNDMKEKTEKYEQNLTRLQAKQEMLQSDDTNVVKLLRVVNRLTKIAGEPFSHDNVNIADLSDADRPTKLSETYSELYDNEWTDAFEELTEDMNLSDEAAIRLLLKILMNAFCKCKEITWDRYESLKLVASTFEVKQEKLPLIITEDKQCPDKSDGTTKVQHEDQNNGAGTTVSNPSASEICLESTSLTSILSIDQEKSLKNIWRATTINLKDESLELLCANLLTCLGKPETEMPKTSKYLRCCTELCWKMGVQEKPMHLDENAEKQVGEEKQFDTDKFRACTRTGKSVAYVVWPALFLYEGGAMLAKGIAQGCQKRVSSKE